MSTILRKNEYTHPVPVGQSEKDKEMWKQIHIKCNLPIEGVDEDELQRHLEEAILTIFHTTKILSPVSFFTPCPVYIITQI